ncbi:AraC-like DNA-binding protein [Nonomuraea muscovyensis]|uniref:AraC-like DNA-binding protein n=1 Tax=Nonomuraea muscovyensis TaxID=1124761 RepID=A0A7X0EYX8_9ACTN|nr:AraC family transcriptional regulator [Nonomuraea muscovyensis]MBB6346161.1 AraC-like DNA-binding protein [Nonomuraea muscovyensis]
MDPFDDLLSGVRADGAIFDRSVLTPPWALRFTDGASLTLCVPLRGAGWIAGEAGGEPRRLALGESAIVRGPEPFVFSTEAPPTQPVRTQPLTTGPLTTGPLRAGAPVREVRGGRVPGDHDVDLASPTVLLVGAYHVRGQVPRRLLRVLPPLIVVPDHHDCTSMRDYLEAQLAGARPGRQIVLDRLLDWLLVCTLREWFDQPEAVRPSWYHALGDDAVGPVLRAMHDAPDRPWTLASLAARSGVSRTTLAKRFAELVGEPPLAYLTDWRMALAADMLADSAETVAAVARRVGYADAFGFSAAFKRVQGVSPSEYRRLERQGAAPERGPARREIGVGPAPGRAPATGGEQAREHGR